MIEFELNNLPIEIDVDPNAPLLWVVREVLGLCGSKFGCGLGLCGACTMHLDGAAVRTCILPVSAVAEKKVTTIEGLANGDQLHPLQQAWIDESVPQCGYCQPGQLMTASAFLTATPTPNDQQIDQAMQGNLCRCGTYPRIKRAIKRTVVKANAQANAAVNVSKAIDAVQERDA